MTHHSHTNDMTDCSSPSRISLAPTRSASIRQLIYNLPIIVYGKWYTAVELSIMLNRGNALSVNSSDITNALRGSRVSNTTNNRYKGVRYFCLGDCLGTTPKDRGLVHIPRIRRDYFTITKECAKTLDIAENNIRDASQRDTINIAENVDEDNSDSEKSNEYDAEIVETEIIAISKKHTGYKISSIDLDREWTQIVTNHVKECPKSVLEVTNVHKNGYELVDTYQCRWCMKIFSKRASRDIMMGDSKRKSADINVAMSVATYVSGNSISKTLELCSEVGIVQPTKRMQTNTRRKLKEIVFDLSTNQLLLNRREHVRRARDMPGYEGDIIFTKDDKMHSICRATLAMDGAGNTRAYSHRIRGNQHSLIVYSLLTMKPMLVVSHQTSCHRCSMELTRLMKVQNIKMNMVQYTTLTHKGVCYRNTSIGPACAE